MYVKPSAGLKVRYPDRPDIVLPEEGAEVAASPYWLRRLGEGSVLKVNTAPRKGGNQVMISYGFIQEMETK